MSHTFYKCPPGCDKPHCQYCQGGLAFCTVCKCAEGTLPTECPGEPVSEEVQENIFNGASDFVSGQWWGYDEDQ